MNKTVMSGAKIAVITLSVSIVYAQKSIYPAEIVGRDLNYNGLGWLGHVGVTAANKISQNGDWVLEILNESDVGQLNTLPNFKSRSKYWGSKYGVSDRAERGQHVIDEANHQRWWCPTYTSSTAYTIGAGDLKWGTRFKCGVWRCDTYTWWAFYSAGYDTVTGRVMLPFTVFNGFPAYNQLLPNAIETTLPDIMNTTLDDVTPEELNNMTFEEFEMIADIPMERETPQHIAAEMRFAQDTHLNDIKRGIFIDRLVISGKEPDTVTTLLKLYNETESTAVKEKIIQGMMIYYQQHLNLSENTNDQMLLKSFFAKLLEETVVNQTASQVVRGFVDLHSSEEVQDNVAKINQLLVKMSHQSSIMLKMSLASKSRDLEKIYIKSIVLELRKTNNSDLDGFLFGPLSMAYKKTGPNVLASETRKEVIEYLKFVAHKYTNKALLDNKGDKYAGFTAPIYFELVKNIGM
jgi:hypothetical protein